MEPLQIKAVLVFAILQQMNRWRMHGKHLAYKCKFNKYPFVAIKSLIQCKRVIVVRISTSYSSRRVSPVGFNGDNDLYVQAEK